MKARKIIIVGQYDSPFVRRAAIALHHYGMQFERPVLSVFTELDKMLEINPLGKIPALILDNGELLVDSQFILTYLDGIADAEHALIPTAGAARRQVLNLNAVAVGLAEKPWHCDGSSIGAACRASIRIGWTGYNFKSHRVWYGWRLMHHRPGFIPCR
ncbi:MAG: glutathione S-transferase N-terminal domain-containing protein [Gammaproteobacteria bacterium]|nr:glutathione S-transferase N-terminal domain-containing protein [Gammaproteobacteria bacterium]